MVNPLPSNKVPANQRSIVPDVTVITHGIPLCKVPRLGPLLPAEVETTMFFFHGSK
jgi:hypothetical protein